MSLGRIAVVGQGYVGLPLSICAAEAGWNVVGIDVNSEIVQSLGHGISHIEDVDSTRIKVLLDSFYEVTTDFSMIKNCKVVIICVPTPLDKNNKPDLHYLTIAANLVADNIEDNTLIISESTSFPGTLRNIVAAEIMNKNRNKKLKFAVAPERVNPGDKNWNQKNTPRLVGGIDELSTLEAIAFYKTICDQVFATSTPEVAETAKLLENSFRLINISMINEFSRICLDSGIPVREVIDAAATKPYGFMPFWPSSGIGGHCIPIDPVYLTEWAKSKGHNLSFIETASQFNMQLGELLIQRIENHGFKIGQGSRVLILGVSYKPGISDSRETPANSIRDAIKKRGGEIEWFDPLVIEWNGETQSSLTSHFDFAIISTNQSGLPINRILEKDITIFDATFSQINPKILQI